MNNPEYIIVDEIETIAAEVATDLGIAINYQYGLVEELNKVIVQMQSNPATNSEIFPLIWVQTPYLLRRGEVGFYGTIENLNIFIIKDCDINWTSKERMDNNYRPTLYPIYRKLMKYIIESPAFCNSVQKGNTASNENLIVHRKIDYFYWGTPQGNYLSWPVDMLQINQIILKVNNNPNCSPFKSL